jgi:hypothetical protein
MEKKILKCHDCGVEQGQIHERGCDWEICSKCGRQTLTCGCNTEDAKRIPYGTVREIAARVPYYTAGHIEKHVKKDLSDAVEKGLW